MLRYTLPALLLLVSGCASWLPAADRVEVRQGNILDAEQIERLEVGMSRAQVREVLGEPVLRESFNRNRWDYIYYLTEAGREAGDVQRLSVYFEGEQVVRVADAYSPPAPPDPADLPDMPDEDQPAPGQPAPGEPAPDQPAPMPSPDDGGVGAPTM